MDKPLPTTIDDYQSAVRWIYDRIDYERIRPKRTSTHFRLERVARLLSLIDSPQKRIPAIHIAGTKGKGSTAAMLDSILTASGIHCGLFTSPHIHKFEERMRVRGAMPSPEELTSLVRELQQRLSAADPDTVEDGPTYFEVAILLTWMYFDRQNVEIAVLETGLGGRLDCTNLCAPLITVITAIGLDHTHILGDTIEQIAGEKAGIIKEGVPVLSWCGDDRATAVITDTAQKKNCWQILGDDQIHVIARRIVPGGQQISIRTPQKEHLNLHLPLSGEHQAKNAALAVAAADLLSDLPNSGYSVTSASISRGLAETTWPLRFETFPGPPLVVLDAAHNPDAIDAFLATLKESSIAGHRPRVLTFASSRDKDAAGMLERLLPHFDTIVLTQFVTNPRSTSTENLKALCGDTAISITTTAAPESALTAAQKLAGPDGLVCGTGSIFLAAELRELLTDYRNSA